MSVRKHEKYSQKLHTLCISDGIHARARGAEEKQARSVEQAGTEGGILDQNIKRSVSPTKPNHKPLPGGVVYNVSRYKSLRLWLPRCSSRTQAE